MGKAEKLALSDFAEIALLVGLDLLFAGSNGFKFLLFPSFDVAFLSVGSSVVLSVNLPMCLSVDSASGDFSVDSTLGLSAGVSVDF